MPIENEDEQEVDHGSAAYTPSQDVVDYVENANRVKNPDDACGVCSECGNIQSDDRMYKSIFAQTGAPPVCTFCGGVVVITYRELVNDRMKEMFDINRGIGRS